VKLFLRRFFTLFITATIFISGNGVVLAIHTCFSTDSRNVSFFSDDATCEKDSHCDDTCDDAIKSDCCSSEFLYQKISATFFLQKTFELPSVDHFSTFVFSLFNKLETRNFLPQFHISFYSLSIPLLLHQLLI
jgi:hypothetical protein